MTQTAFGETEKGEHLFSFQLELYEESATNFIDKYITPNLSLEYDGSEKIRDTASQEIINKLNQKLENYKKEYKISELAIYQKRIGSKVDIEIAILSNNGDILKVINNLSEEIIKIDGVSSISNNGKIGTDQMTLKINKYGESLGLNETILSENLSNLYLLNKKGSFSYNKELLDIKIEDINKNNIQNLKNSLIKIGDKIVSLGDVVDFVLSKQLQTIDKYNFKEMKSILLM